MNKSLIILLVIVCIGVTVVILQKKSKERYHIHTNFKEIDHEHTEIANALTNLLKACKKHWNTEERLFQEGKMKVPKNHPQDVDKVWKEHNDEHKKFIKRIEQFGTDVNNHIKKYDIPHFHFGPDDI